MRGYPVTERERLQIGRLASYLTEEGTWKLSYEQIAKQLDLDPRTISDQARQALVREWERTRWRAPEPGDS